MTEYALGFCFDLETRRVVLLIKKNKPEWQKGLFNGIGGKIEESDETPIDAMCREFAEETGLETYGNAWEQYATLRGPDWTVHVCRYFMTGTHMATYKQMTDETVELFSVFDIPYEAPPQISNLQWLIPLALDENYGRSYQVTAVYG